ncbi:MAG: hypothetical protein ACLFU8_13155 [Anaerolineales bacterium]
MGTQGVVAIMQDGDVVVKAVAGCNGDRAPTLATRIIRAHDAGMPVTAATVAELAHEAGFGCSDCLVVLDELTTVAVEPPRSAYRETFDDARWNPRWERGTADWVSTVALDE